MMFAALPSVVLFSPVLAAVPKFLFGEVTVLVLVNLVKSIKAHFIARDCTIVIGVHLLEGFLQSST